MINFIKNLFKKNDIFDKKKCHAFIECVNAAELTNGRVLRFKKSPSLLFLRLSSDGSWKFGFLENKELNLKIEGESLSSVMLYKTWVRENSVGLGNFVKDIDRLEIS